MLLACVCCDLITWKANVKDMHFENDDFLLLLLEEERSCIFQPVCSSQSSGRRPEGRSSMCMTANVACLILS